MTKILDIKKLKKLIKKNKNIKVGLCHGVFDILHYGHIKHFEEAKKHCDILIVSLTTDKYVRKGNGRPYFNEKIRVNTLASLSVVDYVVISKYPTAVEIISAIKPNFYFKDTEYKNLKNDITGNIKKGFTPINAGASAEATYVNEGTITVSPAPISIAIRARLIASVPLAHVIECFAPVNLHNSSSRILTSGPIIYLP